jgi:hypothetical protein
MLRLLAPDIARCICALCCSNGAFPLFCQSARESSTGSSGSSSMSNGQPVRRAQRAAPVCSICPAICSNTLPCGDIEAQFQNSNIIEICSYTSLGEMVRRFSMNCWQMWVAASRSNHIKTKNISIFELPQIKVHKNAAGCGSLLLVAIPLRLPAGMWSTFSDSRNSCFVCSAFTPS